MVRSLGLVLAVVVVVFLIARPSASNSQRVRTVDYGPDVARARAVAPYQVLAPVGLGAGWRSTSSRVDAPAPGTPGPVALHIGFVTPRDAYAALEESNAETDAFVADRTTGAAPRGSVVVGGRLWEQRQATDATRALVQRGGGATLVVTGTASVVELTELAAALR